MYGNLIRNWERRCHDRDIDKRQVRPFEWGLEFLGNVRHGHNGRNGHHGHPDHTAHHPKEVLERFNSSVLADSDSFYTPPPGRQADFDFDGRWLRFPSAVETPYPKNNLVHARYFPAGADDCAVIVSPQWNGSEEAHVAICRGLNYFGISALRLSLPYHDRRMPEELTRADYMVSSNIGRTIQSVRQAVQDVRRAADWLRLRGVKRIGVMGTSIGSCTSWLAFVHDERLEVGVFNHVSAYFGDVVWEGITTSHIRQSLEEHLTPEEARRVWLAISPSAFMQKAGGLRRRALMITARYDLTFPYDLSRIVFEDCARYGVKVDKVVLPCGHYTSGKAPFKFLDGYHIVNYFRRAWR
ncbi:MAG TPA: abhydrolase domain-containing 18 [Blastocatellia bacterium]|nr:abhydrolase domain-containing 18 [Blastocatellia bacterium]